MKKPTLHEVYADLFEQFALKAPERQPEPTPEQRAQQQLDIFLDWATDPNLVVFDTETTDLDGEIIEIGLVDGRGNILMDQRVRPHWPIHPKAFEAHGITADELKDCPTFGQVWPQLRDLLEGRRVVVYNAQFDYRRICTSLDVDTPGWEAGDGGPSEDLRRYWALRFGCVMKAYAPIHGAYSDWGGYRWAKLARACEVRGVDTSDLRAHSAVGDALATLRLIRATAELTPADVPWIGREEEQ